MKKYKAVFYLNNSRMETVIQAPSYAQAMAMVKAQYPTATSVSVSEIR